MTDAEYLFKTDCSEKKRIARSARKTNRVGKGPVRLPSDNLTKKELRKMNGDVITYNMNRPISWKEFLKYPHDIQQEYLDSIAAKYHPNAHDLTVMFRANNVKTIYTYFRRHKLNAHLSKNMPDCSSNNEWLKWCCQEPEKPIVKETVPPILGGKVELCGTLEEITRTLRNICHEDYSYVFKITFKDGMKVK